MVRVLVILAFLAAWFLPLIIAALYKLPHQGPIAVLSLALGWTGVGWLAALVITIGGAIRATRPALAGQEQPQAAGGGQAYAPAQAAWGSSSAARRDRGVELERPVHHLDLAAMGEAVQGPREAVLAEVAPRADDVAPEVHAHGPPLPVPGRSPGE